MSFYLILFFLFFFLAVIFGIALELYKMSRGCFLDVIPSYLKRLKTRNPRTAAICLYNIANLYTWAGNYVQAQEWLAKIQAETLRKSLLPSYYFLRVLNALFLDQPPESYAPALENLRKHDRDPQSLLLLSYIEDLRGNPLTSDEFISRYLEMSKRRFRLNLLVLPRTLRKAQMGFFLGHDYLKRNPALAQQHLSELASIGFKNCYSEQAGCFERR